MGVRTCLHSLTIRSFFDSYVLCSCLLDFIGFSHIFYPTWCSVDKQENTNKENNKQGMQTSIGNQLTLVGLVLLDDGLVYLGHHYYVNMK